MGLHQQNLSNLYLNLIIKLKRNLKSKLNIGTLFCKQQQQQQQPQPFTNVYFVFFFPWLFDQKVVDDTKKKLKMNCGLFKENRSFFFVVVVVTFKSIRR